MSPIARRPFRLALIASLLLHLAVLTSPGWHLPLFDDESEPRQLDASLVIPVAAPPPPRVPDTAPLPPSRPPKPAREAAVAPVARPVAPPAEPVRAPEPPPAAEPASEAPLEPAGAVPPAPIFAHADIWPKVGRIVFQVMRSDGFVVGQAEHRWRHDGRQYELRAVTETTGLAAMFKPAVVAQESRGNIGSGGLQPVEYSLSREGKLKESARFDPAQRRIFHGNGLDSAYRPGTQDMLSLFYQLGAFSFDAGTFAISVASGRKLTFFSVAVGESENLESPLGARAVRHLTIAGPAREDATEVWLDTQTRLPLKIRHRDRKGDIFDQIATAIELEKNQP